MAKQNGISSILKYSGNLRLDALLVRSFEVGSQALIGTSVSNQIVTSLEDIPYRYVSHHSVHKLVKVLHSDLLEEVHVSKDVDWT